MPSAALAIPVSHGSLEAILWEVERPRAAAIVCHPHPLHGGNLHNHLPYRIAEALRDAGVSALRFNFRGVGASTGSYDGGAGELDDARAALDFLASRHPGVPLWSTGFSFGAHVSLLLAAEDARVEKTLGAGLALSMFGFGFLRELRKPKAIVQSEFDELGALDGVEQLVESLPEPKRLFVIRGADHLATGRLGEAEAVLAAAVRWLADAS